MGSCLYSVDCKNCGGDGWVDDDYKEGIRKTDCENCNYKLEEEYDVITKEVKSKQEKGLGSKKINK